MQNKNWSLVWSLLSKAGYLIKLALVGVAIVFGVAGVAFGQATVSFVGTINANQNPGTVSISSNDFGCPSSSDSWPPPITLCNFVGWGFTPLNSGSAAFAFTIPWGPGGNAAIALTDQSSCSTTQFVQHSIWPLQSTTTNLTVPVVKGTHYCIFVASQSCGGSCVRTGSVSVQYNLPAVAPPDTSGGGDGPLPLWAYGLLGLSMWWIARRQLKNSGSPG